MVRTFPNYANLVKLVLVIALVMVALAMLAIDSDPMEDYGVSEEEMKEILGLGGASDSAPPPDDFDCPFKLTDSMWAELQAQYDRTPAIGDGFSASGEHYMLIALLNRWNLFPDSREAALELAEMLLTYCRE